MKNDLIRSSHSLLTAFLGLLAVGYLAHAGYLHDGETTSALATVLMTSIAVHKQKDKTDD